MGVGTEPAGATPGRADRRKARTRAALVRAAQGFLAEGRVGVSIRDITDAADVGFGTFYGHFETKEQLLEEAAGVALDGYAAMLATLAEGLTDPAEVFAVSFRMAGRLQRRHPELVRVILNSGTAILLSDSGMARRARADIAAAQAAGRFDGGDPDVAFMVAGGAMLGVMQMLDADPGLDAGAVADQFAVRVLRMLGIPVDEAAALCATTPPEVPELP
ncbi:TetR/AcrR family transcriptional regulator [Actinoplanes sp. NPDC051851]|uniref:TetR/AcrR family transcriptional regulator n=1 Tax=Actinoplanes sp. NPDC051851 TaxID=3154753 RepID=UPI00342F403F